MDVIFDKVVVPWCPPIGPHRRRREASEPQLGPFENRTVPLTMMRSFTVRAGLAKNLFSKEGAGNKKKKDRKRGRITV